VTRPGAGRCGTLYLLRCNRPCQPARHDSGAHALVARLAGHGTSGGARILHAQRQAGGSWHITRTWPGGKHEEPAIKQWKQAPKLCPDGTPGIQRGAMAGVARAAERVRVGQARRYAAAEPEPGGDQVLTGYAARGRQDAARFLSFRRDATVGQFGRAAAERQTPVTKATAHPETTPGKAHSPRSSPQRWKAAPITAGASRARRNRKEPTWQRAPGRPSRPPNGTRAR
jgi:hypothetical protein